MKKYISLIFLLLLTEVLANNPNNPAENFESIIELDEKINFRPLKKLCQVFVLSSELNISAAKPILEKSPDGLYITVGSDRGFNLAANNSGTKYLLMLDYAPEIINYNKINIKLLLAPNLKKYREIRWTKSYNDWNNFAKKYNTKLSKNEYTWWQQNVMKKKTVYNSVAKNLNKYGIDKYYLRFTKIYKELEKYYKNHNISRDNLLYPLHYDDWQKKDLNLSKKDFDWWNKRINIKKINPWYSSAKDMIADPYNHKIIFNYVSLFDKNSSYFHNDKLYNQLHILAKTNKIAICQIDLSNQDHVKKLGDSIKKSNLKISVLDLDNLWDYVYMHPPYLYNSLVNELIKYGDNNSILLTMNNYMEIPHFQYHLYIGFTFGNVKKWDPDFRLMNFMSESIKLLPLFNGRLFDEKQQPQWHKLVL